MTAFDSSESPGRADPVTLMGRTQRLEVYEAYWAEKSSLEQGTPMLN